MTLLTFGFKNLQMGSPKKWCKQPQRFTVMQSLKPLPEVVCCSVNNNIS